MMKYILVLSLLFLGIANGMWIHTILKTKHLVNIMIVISVNAIDCYDCFNCDNADDAIKENCGSTADSCFKATGCKF